MNIGLFQKFAFFLTFVISLQLSFAQHKTIGDTILLHEVKYENGKISARSWLLQSTGNGRAACWNPQGKVMFDSEISRNHGHHSVHFEHHANKVVSKIEESSAPDAGIQWYRSYFYFDENGNKTGENYDSHEDLIRVRVPEKLEQPKQETQEIAKCAVIYSNETWFTNQTEFTLLVSYSARNEIKNDTIASGESIKMGNMIQAQYFEDPSKIAVFKAEPIKKTKRSSKWEFFFHKTAEEKIGESSKQYYFSIVQKLKINKK